MAAATTRKGAGAMQTHVILTLTGPDRIGIVDELTGRVLERGGNVEASRMARLGGEFAVLMLVALPAGHADDLAPALSVLADRGYKLTVNPARPARPAPHPGWHAYRIEAEGADHEGIIHEVAHHLSERGISIEQIESDCRPASTSGVPLFSMTAEVVAPPDLAEQDWQPGLADLARRLNLEIAVTAVSAG
jgi:glycine cleavage system transcriptional repressor